MGEREGGIVRKGYFGEGDELSSRIFAHFSI